LRENESRIAVVVTQTAQVTDPGDTIELPAAVVGLINARHGTEFDLVGRLAGGRQGGAWRVSVPGAADAVLKWSENSSLRSRRPQAPAMVGRLRQRGYPTPVWLVSGVTERGLSYVVQEFVDGEAGSWSSIPLPEVLAAIELQDGLGEPASETWSTYVEWVLSSDDGPVGYLRAMGKRGQGIVKHYQRVVAPFQDCRLPDGDLVHGDLNTGNLLVRDGRLVAIVDIEAIGPGTRVVDYAWLLREAYSVLAPPADKALIQRAGQGIAGRGVLAKCAAATALDIVAFEHRRGEIGNTDLIDRMHQLADDL
jgi:hypothetical protein